MLKHARYALMPVVAALVLAITPAEAISLGAGTSAGAAATTTSGQTQQLSKKQLKKQLKKQRRLEKKCAKLAAGKIKKAKTRAKYQALCATPGAPSAPGQGDGGSGPILDEGAGDETPAGEAGSPGDGGGTPDVGGSTPGGGYVDEILDLPPVFTPPVGGGQAPGEGAPGGGLPQLPAPALEVLPPTQDVPEPGSLALLGLGLVGLGLARRRRQQP